MTVAEAMPDFFIPGAPKAGTTSLAGWLAAHPAVGFCDPKEPRFFNTDFTLPSRPTAIEAYLGLFPPRTAGGLRGEATTGYLVSRVAIDAILRLNPAAKFIVCLRDPAELFLSLHRQRLKEGYETLVDPRAAWEASAARQLGEGMPKTCPDRQMLDYPRYAAIGDQIEALMARVPADRILVLFTEELGRDPQAAFDRSCDFLGLARAPIAAGERANTARIPRSPLVARSLRALGLLRRRLGIRRGFGVARMIERVNLRKPGQDVDPAFRATLDAALEPQRDKLRALIGRAPGDPT